MCGIAGMFSCDQVLTGHEPYLAAMSEALSPRGPDQAGAYYHQGCALLHRRLVVVDPEGGRQPMTYKTVSYTHLDVYKRQLHLCTPGFCSL